MSPGVEKIPDPITTPRINDWAERSPILFEYCFDCPAERTPIFCTLCSAHPTAILPRLGPAHHHPTLPGRSKCVLARVWAALEAVLDATNEPNEWSSHRRGWSKVGRPKIPRRQVQFKFKFKVKVKVKVTISILPDCTLGYESPIVCAGVVFIQIWPIVLARWISGPLPRTSRAF